AGKIGGWVLGIAVNTLYLLAAYCTGYYTPRYTEAKPSLVPHLEGCRSRPEDGTRELEYLQELSVLTDYPIKSRAVSDIKHVDAIIAKRLGFCRRMTPDTEPPDSERVERNRIGRRFHQRHHYGRCGASDEWTAMRSTSGAEFGNAARRSGGNTRTKQRWNSVTAWRRGKSPVPSITISALENVSRNVSPAGPARCSTATK